MSTFGARGSVCVSLRAVLLGGTPTDESTTLSTLDVFVWFELFVPLELSVSMCDKGYRRVDTGGGAASSKLLAVELTVFMRARGWLLCPRDEGVASWFSLMSGRACESFLN